MKILLADPHPDVRTALRLLLEQQLNIHVVGEACDTLGLFSQITNDCPDIVLLDVDLPGVQLTRRRTKSSLSELVEILHKFCPALRVICLSSQPGAEKDCVLAKADAFFCKSNPPDALLALLQRILPGTRGKTTSKTWVQKTN